MEDMILYDKDNKSGINIMLDKELKSYFPESFKYRLLANEHCFEYWTCISIASQYSGLHIYAQGPAQYKRHGVICNAS